MPNRPIHDIAGLLAGSWEGARLATQSGSPHPLVEIAGAAVGGVLGSRIPDVVDAPTCPRHRGIAHGLPAGGFVASLPIKEWQEACRTRAILHEAKLLAQQEGSVGQLIQQLLVWFWHTVAGMLGGLRAGYLSHLALDATTSMSLPLIGLRV